MVAERDEASASAELHVQELNLANLELRKKVCTPPPPPPRGRPPPHQHTLKAPPPPHTIQVRLLQSEGPNAGVFDVYESEITSLRNELERTRAECSELEATCRDAQLQLDASRASGPGSPPGYGAAVDGKLARVRSWRRSSTSCPPTF